MTMLAVDIKLDTVSILDKIESAIITYDREAIHNKITITSKDSTLFSSVAPDYSGDARLVATIGLDTLSFLVEPPLSGDERQFSFGGRSLTAREESLYAGDVSYDNADEPSGADADFIAGELLTIQTLDWNLDADLFLPQAYSWYGSPIAGVDAIAVSFGAITRADDAGNVVVDTYYPENSFFPPYTGTSFPSGTPDLTINIDDDILEYSIEVPYMDRMQMTRLI